MLAKSTQGKGSTVIFFLHWLSGSGRAWRDVAALLSDHFQCVVIDLPGFGKSANVDGFTVQEMAASVIATIREERADAWILVGHSMGAKVAAVVARHAEDGGAGLSGLKAIVLLAGSPPGPEPMEESRREEMLAWFAGEVDERRSQARRFLDANREQKLGLGMEEDAIEDILRMNRDAWVAWLSGGSREDWSSRVGVLRTPALIAAGKKDPDLGEAGQKALMLPHFAFAGMHLLDGAKHLLPMEFPDHVSALIVEASKLRTDEEVRGLSIPADYLTLLESQRVSPQTRSVLLERAAPDSPTYQPLALSIEDLATLRAVANRVVPQDVADTPRSKIDLAARVDRQLAEGKGNGWRYDVLPPDREAYSAGLHTLDLEAKRAHGVLFCALPYDKQNGLLQDAAKGKLGSGLLRRVASAMGMQEGLDTSHSLNGVQMQRWFEEVRADLVRAYVAHPAALARMGYSGIADGADADSMPGFVNIGFGQRECWEPAGDGDLQ